MTRKITKSAAAERIHKLAMAARAVQRVKSGGCCGRKPSSKRKRRVFKRSSLNKEASRDLMRKMACAIAVIQRTRGLQKRAEDDTPLWKNPIAIGTAGGGLIGGTLGAVLGPRGQRFLSGLAGAGIGAAAGAGAGYGYTKLKKKPEEEKTEEERATTPAITNSPVSGRLEDVSQSDIDLFGLPPAFRGYQKVRTEDNTGFNIVDAEGQVVAHIDDAG